MVDDNPDALKVLSAFLKSLGHRVEACETGREALLWLDDLKPEIIMTDLEMPEMDGYQFLAAVRQRSQFQAVPVLCVTGLETPTEEILSHGFHTVLRKPITLADVMNAVDELIKAPNA
jgi:two-component system CheB/CheR fusion protein